MIKNNFKVLFAASECVPFVKVGGLGDVISSLSKTLKELRVDVRICLPKYQVVDSKKYKFKLIAKNIEVRKEKINIYSGFLPDSKVIVYLLENEKYFGKNGVYEGLPGFEGIQRFLFFSQAILEIFSVLNPVRNAISNEVNWFPQIIHCHDWHTAIIATLLKIKNQKSKIKNIKTLLTIHNLSIQGKWEAAKILDFLNLTGDELPTLKNRDADNDFNIFQQGILNADLINTVSENYKKEILTKEYGEGLEKTLMKRKNDLYGILNGIDIKDFNPTTDSVLRSKYSALDFKEKKQNKIDLQKILRLPQNVKTPVFSFIGRLDPQKGIDLIQEIIPELLKLNCQLIILGTGDQRYKINFMKIAKRHPQNISCQFKFDSILAKKIYAGSDFFLMPSKFEPCGLGAMIAQRYGSIPIVRATGGLAEIVQEGETGFIFKKYDSMEFLISIKKAFKIFKKKKQLELMIKLAMKKDFSWKKSVKKYLKIYQKLL